MLAFSSLCFGVFKVSLVVVGDIVQYHCLILYLHQLLFSWCLLYQMFWYLHIVPG